MYVLAKTVTNKVTNKCGMDGWINRGKVRWDKL